MLRLLSLSLRVNITKQSTIYRGDCYHRKEDSIAKTGAVMNIYRDDALIVVS